MQQLCRDKTGAFYVICFFCCLTRFSFAEAQSYCGKRGVETSIDIHASPDSLWQLLTNFDNYPSWHPYLLKAEGAIKPKNKIQFTYLDADSTIGHFSAKILDLDSAKMLSWGGSLGFIFSAKHYYRVEIIDANTIRCIQGEYWHGIFGGIYGRKVYVSACVNFTRQNEKMKVMLEAGN